MPKGDPPRQVKWQKPGRKSGLAGSLKFSIGNAELKSFGQNVLRDLNSELGVVFPVTYDRSVLIPALFSRRDD